MAGRDPQDLSIAAARQRMLDAVGPVTDTERLTLAKAHGRALAEPVIAPCALPREDHSALDGYALRGSTPGPVTGFGSWVAPWPERRGRAR